MQWYFAESGQQVGPIEDEAFRGFINSGRITDETLVWRQGMTSWQPYKTIAQMEAPVAVAAAAPSVFAASPHEARFCTECGRPFAPDDLVAFGSSLVCAYCKPVFTQRLREGVVPAGSQRYGGFWIRFLAILIDGLILEVVSLFLVPLLFGTFTTPSRLDPRNLAPFFAAMGLAAAVSFLMRMVYETAFVGRYGATPGKMVCHVKVVRPDGRPVTYLRSWCRFLAKELNTFTLLIGFIIAGFDDEKRALHDRICDTRVVHT